MIGISFCPIREFQYKRVGRDISSGFGEDCCGQFKTWLRPGGTKNSCPAN